MEPSAKKLPELLAALPTAFMPITRKDALWYHCYLSDALLPSRDCSVLDYKEMVLEICWASVRPLLTILVAKIPFGELAEPPPHGNLPYPLPVPIGMIPWGLSAGSWTEAEGQLLQRVGGWRLTSTDRPRPNRGYQTDLLHASVSEEYRLGHSENG